MIKRIFLFLFLFAISSLVQGQSLVIGMTMGEIVNIKDTSLTYDTVYITKDGILNVENARLTINNFLVVDSIAQLNVRNSNFNMNGQNIFYTKSTSVLKDSISIGGDIFIGGNANLLIDSAIVDMGMSFIGQYEFVGFDSAVFRIKNSSFFLGNGKIGGGFRNAAFFSQENVVYKTPVGIAMTLGLLEEATYYSDNCKGGVELIIKDSCTVDIDSTNMSILWFSFSDASIAHFSFPVQNSLMSYASDVSYFAFSDSLPNVFNVDYDVKVHRSDTVFWGLFIDSGSDVIIDSSSVMACGFTFTGTKIDTLMDFINDSLYVSHTIPLSDRSLSLINTKVRAWNFYPLDTTKIIIKDCLFGEVLSYDEGNVMIENSICDGTGGYLGAYNNAKIHVKNSIIKRDWSSSPAIILNNDNSYVVIEESVIKGEVMINDFSTLIYSNTIYDHSPQINGSTYFLEVFLDTISLAYCDSFVDVNGTLIGVNGITNNDSITRYRLEYSLADSTQKTLIQDTSFTPSIIQNLIKTWNTDTVAQGDYILWLTVYVDGDSVITASREVFLSATNNIVPITNAEELSLSIYPNPSNGVINITYQVSKRGRVELVVYDVLANKLFTLVVATKEKGSYSYTWETRKFLQAGVYLVEFKNEDSVVVEKIIIN